MTLSLITKNKEQQRRLKYKRKGSNTGLSIKHHRLIRLLLH